MSLLLPLERLLVNLEEHVSPEYVFIHVPKDAALKQLEELTGQAFGYDAKRWRCWLEERAMVPKRNIPAAMLKVLEDDCPAGYVRSEDGKARALLRLRDWTGQDFGFGATKWRVWLEANGFVPSKIAGS
ncbi:MAG: hypothetical protein L0Y72_08705 [Gemmataceae bacterium]|nr:hypothetical protein [Gemmataceae bacterium]MCI0739111.1 hypothetical protein [Gemmataceae bacterium]